MLPELLSVLPSAPRLIEPFVGAGSVFLSGRYSQAVLNDANADLVAVWTSIKERPAQFALDASSFFVESNHSEAAYLRIRQEFNSASDRYERAVRFIYLNRFGFNGLFRVNGRGEYNVPYGRPKALPLFPWTHVEAAARRLETAVVLGGDFRFAMELAQAGDVLYCDPPYLPLREKTFTSYTQKGFDLQEHEVLVKLALKAASRGAFVAISNHDTPQVRELYSGFEIHSLMCARNISGKTASRKPVCELIAVAGPDLGHRSRN
jgi:DNA adenine methylase